ncbi:DAK2 domain-containing protein [Sinorhizobium sp. 6-70]|uniref:DAK2 domain-containing protein n=1 Tax=Sinorhizobium sp. 6-70 TaxID=3049088 RepID=UPI0024C31E28|nr:DAK2 domain-containing protein [Sinorhizobium sp. 6-70]MDK1373648.1 DAK2 domain-containing protein [Sinorhizobium sp. 6-70]
MELTVFQIAEGVSRAARAMAGLEQELNAADAKLGDGDTGSMLARVIGAMAASEPQAAGSVSDVFGRLARAGMSATGSSLGTLFASSLLGLSKQTREWERVDWEDLSSLLAAARDGMMARGNAKLGDKTVLDALDAVAAAVAGEVDAEGAARAAREAVDRVILEFRGRPCRMGRAKFFAEKSVGLDDPGMLAFVALTKAVAELPQNAT